MTRPLIHSLLAAPLDGAATEARSLETARLLRRRDASPVAEGFERGRILARTCRESRP